MQREYQICARCVMDTTDPDIVFDENGYCNHCKKALANIKALYADDELNRAKLNIIIQTVKNEGKNKNYDCIIGLSGGIDSSYLAYVLVNNYGLRPLAIHVDNGWNSEVAVENIHKIVNSLSIDLLTHVIDWEEFKDLQKSFLRASVVDLEMLSDHAIAVVIKNITQKKKIRYFLIGSNYQTESILPSTWYYPSKHDSLNIIDIHNKYGELNHIKTFPFLSFFSFLTFKYGYGKNLAPLSHMHYDKDEAKLSLEKETGWQDYGAKHHESFITKFYQSYILPKKFSIDKRRAHLSSLICAGQITREAALVQLRRPFYNTQEEENEAIQYFCKKLDLAIEEFQEIMREKRHEHKDFHSFQKRKLRVRNLIYGKKKR